MNSFTHPGFMQGVRCNSEDKTGPNYFSGEISSVLKVSNVLGLYAALELAMIGGNVDLQNKIAAIFRKFVSAL